MIAASGDVSGAPGFERVSRETFDRIDAFLDFALAVNRRLNLFAATDKDAALRRHVFDSLQLLDLAPASARRWVDLGTGGGFPGLVIGLAAESDWPETKVMLVESDRRKAAFLAEAGARFAPRTSVFSERAESLTPLEGDVVSARALAPLDALLGLVRRHLGLGGVALLPKGRHYEGEVTKARRLWRFDLSVHESRSDREGRVLEVRSVEGA